METIQRERREGGEGSRFAPHQWLLAGQQVCRECRGVIASDISLHLAPRSAVRSNSRMYRGTLPNLGGLLVAGDQDGPLSIAPNPQMLT